MIEKGGKYPAYEGNKNLNDQKVMLSMSYESLLELANVLYYVNKVCASIPRIFGGIKLSHRSRALHKLAHDSIVNCALSLEEKFRFEQGAKREAD